MKYPTEFDFSNVDPQTEEVSVSFVRITWELVHTGDAAIRVGSDG